MFSCKDYDTQFDELTNMVASLEADNRALESQIAAVQAQDALIAQEISARLTEFAAGVSAALAQIGAGVTGSVQMLQGIMASLSQLATAIAANSLTTDEINAQLDTLEELLKKVEADLEAHHTSGGSHTSGGN